MDISTKTLEELKAMAYDLIKQINMFQNNLNVVEQSIQKKQQEEVQKRIKEQEAKKEVAKS